MRISKALSALVAVAQLPCAAAQLSHVNGTIETNSVLPDDLNGSNFTYPWPISLFKFKSQGQPLEMAFMDIPPSGPSNNKTAVVLHGNYFCSVTWNTTIIALTSAGYRVVAPDHIGYCKSTKPVGYQFSLQQIATNLNGLLKTLGVDNATIIGHSFGGSISIRYGLMYPDQVENLALVNPIGLEPYTAKGVPYLDIDDNTVTSSQSTWESIKQYEQTYYYVGDWEDAYGEWVTMVYNVFQGTQKEKYWVNQAQIVDVVLTQPIAFELSHVMPRTLLLIGQKDRTAIGAAWSPPAVAATLGNWTELSYQVASLIPNATLHAFPNLGHAPQISDPDQFNTALVQWLAAN